MHSCLLGNCGDGLVKDINVQGQREGQESSSTKPYSGGKNPLQYVHPICKVNLKYDSIGRQCDNIKFIIVAKKSKIIKYVNCLLNILKTLLFLIID